LRQLDSKVTAGRGLAFYAYQVIAGTDTQEHLAAMEEAKSYGFEVALDVVSVSMRDRLSCADLEDLLAHWDEVRRDCPYDTDGLVFKVDYKATQEALGYTGRVPRWAIAYKFPPKSVITSLLSVDFQVGRTGAVTPVANLQPVVIDGVFVGRATIHNADELLRLGLCYDDHVVVHRAGEVIPQILRAMKPNVEGEAKPRGTPVVFPLNCPECGTPLERMAAVRVQHAAEC
jgi:DNA ligase (NAD+)